MVVAATALPAASRFGVVKLAGIDDDLATGKLEVCKYFLQVLRFEDDVVVFVAEYVVLSQKELRLTKLTVPEGGQVESSASVFEVCLFEALPS